MTYSYHFCAYASMLAKENVISELEPATVPSMWGPKLIFVLAEWQDIGFDFCVKKLSFASSPTSLNLFSKTKDKNEKY